MELLELSGEDGAGAEAVDEFYCLQYARYGSKTSLPFIVL